MIYKPAIDRMVKNWNESADVMTTINEETINKLPIEIGNLFIVSVPQLHQSAEIPIFWIVDLSLPIGTIVAGNLREYAAEIYNSTGIKKTRIRFEGRIWDYYQAAQPKPKMEN